MVFNLGFIFLRISRFTVLIVVAQKWFRFPAVPISEDFDHFLLMFIFQPQICHEFERFSTYLPDTKVVVSYGGVNIKIPNELLKNECPHVVLGTPGRYLHRPGSARNSCKMFQGIGSFNIIGSHVLRPWSWCCLFWSNLVTVRFISLSG
ncbi:hypothetical protein MKW98_004319 [Papaver atlanticum]|uniref:Uncharacterized protein n=1 Tax=Papaver atlanticum TaxID=357466 RepID=A0AAD4T969_9MAGN|nr:hypothetical protein MKW98_004319 [Papaver atlanticum]